MTDTVAPFDEHDPAYVALQQTALNLLVDIAQTTAPAAVRSPVRHRKPSPRYAVLARRLILFNGVGALVFVLGTLLQWPLVHPLGAAWSYAVQTLVSVEVSWVFNRWLTWRDRHVGTGISVWRWNAQRAVSTVLMYFFYLGLMRVAGMGWLAANVVSTALFVPVNYWVGDRWSFAPVIERHLHHTQPSPQPVTQAKPVLPQEPPPTDTEKTSYLRRHLPWLAIMTIAGFASSLVSQGAMEYITRAWVLTPYTALGVIYGILSLAGSYAGRGDFDYAEHQEKVRAWLPHRYPTVDIFLPVCGEAPEVLLNTWAHVSRLIDAYPGLARAYVLDDGNKPYARQMAAGFEFIYTVRPDRGFMKKAGNLRHGFRISNGDFILILDADFAPRSDMLTELLPYFDEKRTGIVQSPQWFRTSMSQPWLQRAAGAVQELFYRSIQVSRDKREASICVGSCAIYRRKALAENGGTTLIEHSEDVHTGFDLRCKGWKLRYLPLPLATGQCPDDFGSFVTQQYRWCAGSMSLLGSRKFWRARMPMRARVCYLAGFCYYIYTAISVFTAPIIPAYLLIVAPQRISPANFLVLTPALTAGWLLFPLWHKTHYGPSYWSLALIRGWAHALALWDILRRKRMGWQVTGSGPKRGVKRARYGIAVWNGGAGLGLLGLCGWRTVTFGDPLRFWVVTGLCLVYLGTVAWIYAPTRLTSWRPKPTATWGLAAVLVLQAILSLRLLRSDTAFADEGLYLYAGHLEWAHWLHGSTSATMQAFPTWFSGAPVVYPPLGAIADAIGGLTAARLLSLAFMMGTSVLLYDVTRRFLDRRAGLFAAVVFAILAPTQALGAFATYDPMAIFMLALATWVGVVAASRKHLISAGGLVMLAGFVLALGDATKYATTLWTPAAVAFTAVAFWQHRGLRAGFLAGFMMGTAWAAMITLGLRLGGSVYWRGITTTTLSRQVAGDTVNTVPQVLGHAAWYIWPAVIFAAAGVVFAFWRGDRTTRAVCCSALLIAFLAPVEQARIHTYASLWKHSDYGAWFAAVAAGYALAYVSRLGWRPMWRAAVALAAASIAMFPGLLIYYTASLMHDYPYSVRAAGSVTEAADIYSWPELSGVVRSLLFVRPSTGPVLFDEADALTYYLDTRTYPGQVVGITGPAPRQVYADISDHRFGAVEIGGSPTIPVSEIEAAERLLARTPGYRLVFKTPYYDQYGSKLMMEVWRLEK